MPGCCVSSWKNSSAKGYLMKYFPRNPEIRAQWALNIPRPNWTPTNYSCICEIHFSPKMWEKPQVDGKRILKHNAIPTIFEVSNTVVASTSNEVHDQTVQIDDRSNLISNKISIEIPEKSTESEVIEVIENEPNSSSFNCEVDWKKKYEKLNDLYKKREKTYDSVLRKFNKSKKK